MTWSGDFEAAGLADRRAVEAMGVALAGSVLHAVGEEGVAYRQIAETIARHLGIKAVSVDAERAVEHFGFLGHFVGADNPTSSTITRELLGWDPSGPGLIDDLEQGH